MIRGQRGRGERPEVGNTVGNSGRRARTETGVARREGRCHCPGCASACLHRVLVWRDQLGRASRRGCLHGRSRSSKTNGLAMPSGSSSSDKRPRRLQLSPSAVAPVPVSSWLRVTSRVSLLLPSELRSASSLAIERRTRSSRSGLQRALRRDRPGSPPRPRGVPEPAESHRLSGPRRFLVRDLARPPQRLLWRPASS